MCLPTCGWAQGVGIAGGFSGSTTGAGGSTISGSGQIAGGRLGTLPGRTIGTGNLQPTLRADPPAFNRRLTTVYHGRSNARTSYFSRIVIDDIKHEYFGYEVLLEEDTPGGYRMTFGPPAISSIELSSWGAPAKEWSLWTGRLPESRIVHQGDVISVELLTDATTGDKLIEDITIQPPNRVTGMVGPLGTGFAAPTVARPIPTVEGPARDFSASDAEMRLTLPRIMVNGVEQSIAPAATGLPSNLLVRNVSGSLVWLYLPGRGRYILSLASRPELGFTKTGEVRGGLAKFTIDGEEFAVECPAEIASGHAPYNLYVSRDAFYEPTAQAQKGKVAVGTVGVAELIALKRP